MTQTLARQSVTTARRDSRDADPAPASQSPQQQSPRLWGLSAGDLHTAYWHARGVQCVCRGEKQHLQRAAELYLLIEPDQMVIFSVADLTARLTWHNAMVTRIRLVDESEERYFEHVDLDENGCVKRIGRRYRPRHQGSSQVVLTRSRRLARLWMSATSRRDAWVRVRGGVPWERVDHWRCAGKVFTNGIAKSERAFIDEVVKRWANPGQAINGIEELEPGVWGLIDTQLPRRGVRIGPLWLGESDTSQSTIVAPTCLVGPTWLGDILLDQSAAETASPLQNNVKALVEVRPIAEVEEDQVNEGVKAPLRRGQPVYFFFKRLFDFTASLAGLIALLPVMLIVSVMVLLEDGWPIFFGHKRQGRGGRLFTCWKFRTMVRNAEQIARELTEYNICDGPQVYIEDDPRVTRVGKLLRPAHLDELPQLWNVLLGQMSLVGPRPSPDDENQFCPAWRDIRLSVRPGITGLWQLYRTREPGEDFQEWIKFDIRYVRNASFLYDMMILAKTARVVAFGRG